MIRGEYKGGAPQVTVSQIILLLFGENGERKGFAHPANDVSLCISKQVFSSYLMGIIFVNMDAGSSPKRAVAPAV